MSKTVCFVTFENIKNYTREYLKGCSVSEKDMEQYLTRFNRLFLDKIQPNTTYVFIITTDQLNLFNEHIDENGIREYITHQTGPYVNTNYSGLAPRLHVFLFNFEDKK